MGKNAFCVVLVCGDLTHLPSLSQVADHKHHVSAVGNDNFYLKLNKGRLPYNVFFC